MIKKDPAAAKEAMWQHLENVKQRLLELSDVDDPNFDGYLFNSYPVDRCGTDPLHTFLLSDTRNRAKSARFLTVK